jgi:hypothetical protein
MAVVIDPALLAIARACKGARPSGSFVMHTVERPIWCQLHGPVTHYHFCRARYPTLWIPGVDPDRPAIPTISKESDHA